MAKITIGAGTAMDLPDPSTLTIWEDKWKPVLIALSKRKKDSSGLSYTWTTTSNVAVTTNAVKSDIENWQKPDHPDGRWYTIK